MAKRVIIYQGTELKLNINIEPLGELTMQEYDFTCSAYCYTSKTVVATKAECVMVDANNYLFLVDTNLTGIGNLYVKVEAQIPDVAFAQSDNLRSEVKIVDTGITIVAKYTQQ